MSEQELQVCGLERIGPQRYKLPDGEVSCAGGTVKYISGPRLEKDGNLVLTKNQPIGPDCKEIFLSLGLPELPSLQGESLSAQELNFSDLGLRVFFCRNKILFIWLEKLQRFQPELVDETRLSSEEGFHKTRVFLSPELLSAPGDINFAEGLSVDGICPGMPLSQLTGWSELTAGFYSSGTCGAEIERQAVKYVEGPVLLSPDATVLLQAGQEVGGDRREVFEALRLPYPRNSEALQRTEPVVPEILEFEDLGINVYLKMGHIHLVTLSQAKANYPLIDYKPLRVSIPEELQICRKIKIEGGSV